MSEVKVSAAVALIITECDSPSVLLLKRAKNTNDPWSGQWAFPGGRWEEGDKDLLDTSIRETYEECGYRLTRDELIMTLPHSRFCRKLFWFSCDGCPLSLEG